jgi:hypothetical protein
MPAQLLLEILNGLIDLLHWHAKVFAKDVWLYAIVVLQYDLLILI